MRLYFWVKEPKAARAALVQPLLKLQGTYSKIFKGNLRPRHSGFSRVFSHYIINWINTNITINMIKDIRAIFFAFIDLSKVNKKKLL
jgi:hypothetical protein